MNGLSRATLFLLLWPLLVESAVAQYSTLDGTSDSWIRVAENPPFRRKHFKSFVTVQETMAAEPEFLPADMNGMVGDWESSSPSLPAPPILRLPSTRTYPTAVAFPSPHSAAQPDWEPVMEARGVSSQYTTYPHTGPPVMFAPFANQPAFAAGGNNVYGGNTFAASNGGFLNAYFQPPVEEVPSPPAAAANEPTRPQDEDGQPKPIGQEPDEDINNLFLRRSTLLLPKGQMQIDWGFNYVYQENEIPIVLGGGFVAHQRVRNRRFLMPVGISYGLTEKLQVFGVLPAGYAHFERSDATTFVNTSRGGIGDLTLGVAFEVARANALRPDITASISVTAPTGGDPFNTNGNIASLGAGYWQMAGRLNFTRSYDPVVVFGSVGYRHGFDDEYLGLDWEPGQTLEYSYGAAMAVNDDVSISATFSGSYTNKTRIGGVLIPDSSVEPMSLRLAMIRRITTTTRIQPFVDFGLNDDASNVSFGITYTTDRSIDPRCGNCW